MTIRLRCSYCSHTAELIVEGVDSAGELQRGQVVCAAHESRARRWCATAAAGVRIWPLAGTAWRQLTLDDAPSAPDPR